MVELDLNHLTIFGIMVILISCGCLSADEECEDPRPTHYYYINVSSNSTGPFTVEVPFILSSERYDLLVGGIGDEYLRKMTVEEGECTYSYMEHGGWTYLRIKGNTSFVLSHQHVSCQSDETFSFDDIQGGAVAILSDVTFLKIIAEFRLTSSEYRNGYFHSSIINPEMTYPVVGYHSLTDQLHESYSIGLVTGEKDYAVTTGVYHYDS